MSNFKKNWETMGFTLLMLFFIMVLLTAPQLILFLGVTWIAMKLAKII